MGKSFDIRTLVGIDADRMAQELRALVKDEAKVEQVIQAALTFIDDDPNGYAQRFDALEVLRVAQYLLDRKIQLTEPIAPRSLADYRKVLGVISPADQTVPAALSAAGHAAAVADVETANMTGEFALRARDDMNMSLTGVDLFLVAQGKDPKTASVGIVVSGPSPEIPLAEMADRYGHVSLIGLDREAMQALSLAVPEHLRVKVSIEVRDTTGGVLTEAYGRALYLIQSSRSLPEAVSRLTRYLHTLVVSPPILEGQTSADVLISCRAINALVLPLQKVMENELKRRFPDALIDEGLEKGLEAALQTFEDRILIAHVQAMGDYVARGGIGHLTAVMSLHVYISAGLADEETALRAEIPWVTHHGEPIMGLGGMWSGMTAVPGAAWQWHVKTDTTIGKRMMGVTTRVIGQGQSVLIVPIAEDQPERGRWPDPEGSSIPMPEYRLPEDDLPCPPRSDITI